MLRYENIEFLNLLYGLIPMVLLMIYYRNWKSKALDYYNQLLRLLKLHPSDLTPALTLVKNTTVFRQKNLQIEINQLNKIN